MHEYKQRGIFRVTQIEADGAFKYLESELQAEPFQIQLITCDTNKHVPRAKRGIRELKYRIHYTRMIMRYKQILRRFVIKLVKQVTMVVNSIPKQSGKYMIQSPCQIMTGLPFQMPQISMGQYVQGHVSGSSNTEEERTVDSLYIGPADNDSGHWIFKLDTKQSISVNRVTVIPMCQDFIDRVTKMGLEDGQPDGIQIGDA